MGIPHAYGPRPSLVGRFGNYLSTINRAIYGNVSKASTEGASYARKLKGGLDPMVDEIGKVASELAGLVAIPAYFGIGGAVTRDIYSKSVDAVDKVQNYRTVTGPALDEKIDEMEYRVSTELPAIIETEVSDEYRRAADEATKPKPPPKKKKKKTMKDKYKMPRKRR
jgi:hypothetical protein